MERRVSRLACHDGGRGEVDNHGGVGVADKLVGFEQGVCDSRCKGAGCVVFFYHLWDLTWTDLGRGMLILCVDCSVVHF